MWNRAEMGVPQMTLELRIQPLVKQVVASMLLNESDVRDTIEEAVSAAVNSFNWREQIASDVRRTIQTEAERVITSLVHKLLWDEEIHAQFKKAIAKALSE